MPTHPKNQLPTFANANSIPSDLVSVSEAAAIAKIHVLTIRGWIRRGEITLYGRPRNYRVSLADVIPSTPAIKPVNTRAKSGWKRNDLRKTDHAQVVDDFPPE